MACSKKHRSFHQWSTLPDAQDNKRNNRHKCPGCAYVEGIKDALNGNIEAQVLSPSIPESQAKAGRHKNAYEAYKEGYKFGTNLIT